MSQSHTTNQYVYALLAGFEMQEAYVYALLAGFEMQEACSQYSLQSPQNI